jgi:hypothetical protein
MNFKRLGKATPQNEHKITAEIYLCLGICDIIFSIKTLLIFLQTTPAATYKRFYLLGNKKI